MQQAYQSLDEATEFQTEQYDEHLLITREYTHMDSSDYDLHRLGYYWPAQVAALPLVK